MRESIKRFVRIIAETLPISEPIYEVGSLQVRGQGGFADLRPLFSGKKYVGCDMREGPGVDRILNLHHLDLPSDSVGTVLIIDTLEHVEFPRKAIKEAHRIIRPDGILVITSVMNFPIHNYPSDYWRFTPEAFKSLLKVFTSQFVSFTGERDYPYTVVGIGFKSPVSEGCLDEFLRRFEEWKRQGEILPKSRHTLVKLFAPPILLNLYRKIRGVR